MHSKLLAYLAASFLAVPMAAIAAPIYADTVISYTPGGNGSGVYDLSGGAYTGASGQGVFDPLAVTARDGAIWAMGGVPYGQIVLSFSGGAVVDGAGADILTWDSFGLWEGLSVEASGDGVSWVSLGTVAGDYNVLCGWPNSCSSGFDLAGSGLASASFFRLTAADLRVGDFPDSYDLDALQAVNFAASVPEPTTLSLIGLSLAGLGFSRRRMAR